ncbi:Kinesin light chain 3 [Rhizophlyctis rosea]|nr:Kinesin light chain 3 [Rhizophlyctis rosea]
MTVIGLSLSGIDAFVIDCGGPAALSGLTTAQVCKKFVVPRTEPSKSLCDNILGSTPESFPKPVGPATHFISHCWKYLFLDLVDAIKNFFGDTEADSTDVIVWIDLFSLPQHGRSKLAVDWLQNVFVNTISEIGNVVMVLTPWDTPTTLTRAWCVFELYACAKTESAFNIALPTTETDLFRHQLRTDPDVYYQTIAGFKSENSTSTEAEDLVAIQTAIHESVGFRVLDRLVLDVLFQWMVATLKSQLALTKETGDRVAHAEWQHSLGRLYSDQGMFTEAETLLFASLRAMEKCLGKDHTKCFWIVNDLAILQQKRRKFQEGEWLFKDCIGRIKRACRDGIEAMVLDSNLASLYLESGRPRDAEPLLSSCWERAKKTFGKEHPKTLVIMHNYAVNMAALEPRHSKTKETERLFIECWECRKRAPTLGESHPATLQTALALATLYASHCVSGGKAAALYTDTLAMMDVSLGRAHPDTLKAMHDAAVELLQGCQRYTEARVLAEECLRRMENVFGEGHGDTLQCLNTLGLSHQRLGNWAEAAVAYRKQLNGLETVLGTHHAETLVCLSNLALSHQLSGNDAEATKLYQMEWDRSRESHGSLSRVEVTKLRHLRDAGIHLERWDSKAMQLWEKHFGKATVNHQQDTWSVMSVIDSKVSKETPSAGMDLVYAIHEFTARKEKEMSLTKVRLDDIPILC